MACTAKTGFRVLSGKEDVASPEIHVFELYPDELPDSASEMVYESEHELVAIILDYIEELLPFVQREVADNFAETLLSLLGSLARGFGQRDWGWW